MLANDALTAAVIGGLLTGAATLLGALLIRWLDIGRENRKLSRQVVGAITTVLSELAANTAILKRHIEARSTYIGDLPLSTQAYRRVELTLAEQLDLKASEAIFRSYAPIEAGDLYQKIEPSDASEAIIVQRHPYFYLDLDECKKTVQQLEIAGKELRRERDRIGGRAWRRRLAARQRETLTEG
jgi:hypothetical protein